MPALRLRPAIVAAVAAVALGVLATAPPTATTLALTRAGPGDNGTQGTASRSRLRHATQPLTAGDLAQADTLAGLLASRTAGSPRTFATTRPTPDGPCFPARRACDRAGHWSAIFNVVTSAGPLAAASAP